MIIIANLCPKGRFITKKSNYLEVKKRFVKYFDIMLDIIYTYNEKEVKIIQ